MRVWLGLITAGVGVGLLGCNHTEPFSTGGYQSVGPLQPGSPTQLTYSPGADTRAAWLPDGSAFLYTQEQVGRPDDDRCFAVMPKSGGSYTRTICAAGDPQGDSLNDLESPAISAGGQMAYVRTAMLAFSGRQVPDNGALVLATLARPDSARVLEPLSYFGPSGRPVDMVADLQWAGSSTLYFVAQQVQVVCANPGCTATDTVVAGLEVERLTVSGTPTASVVANTDQAVCLAMAPPDTLYYALNGSSQVHRRIVSSGADTVAFDFGSGSITGISAGAGRLAAVVGGELHLLTLASASDTVLVSPAFGDIIAHPALDPTGHRLVADVSVPGFPPNLWLWTVP